MENIMFKQKKQSKNREYFRLTQPNWWYFFLQILTNVIHVTFKALSTYFAAKIIVGVGNGISTGDFSGAYKHIILELTCVIIRNLATWFNYVVYNKVYSGIFNKLQKKVIDKCIKANTSNFSTTSKETVINIIGSDVSTLASFTDYLTTKIGVLVQAFISLFIVAQASIWVAGGLLVLCFLNFFILKLINSNIAKMKKKQARAKDNIFEKATKIMNGKDVINEFHRNDDYDDDFIETCKKYTVADKKRILINGFKATGFYVFYYSMCSLLTALMVYLVSKGTVPYELYIVVVPYFITITELFNSFFEVTTYIYDRDIAMARVNTILNFSDETMNKFGSISDQFGGANISFVGVTYNNTDTNSPYVGQLKDVDISFSTKNINLIYGGKRSGKRLIFNMLRKKITPDQGVIAIDNINIKEYDPDTFSNNIYYCVSNPYFIDGTIMENLLVSTKNKNAVYEVCKDLDIYEDIMALEKGFDTNIQAGLTRGLKFLIGMARALLTNCTTLMVYELPNSLTKRDKEKIIMSILKISLNKTIILFSYNEELAPIAKTVYHIEDGDIIDIKINQTPDFSLLDKCDLD